MVKRKTGRSRKHSWGDEHCRFCGMLRYVGEHGMRYTYEPPESDSGFSSSSPGPCPARIVGLESDFTDANVRSLAQWLRAVDPIDWAATIDSIQLAILAQPRPQPPYDWASIVQAIRPP